METSKKAEITFNDLEASDQFAIIYQAMAIELEKELQTMNDDNEIKKAQTNIALYKSTSKMLQSYSTLSQTNDKLLEIINDLKQLDGEELIEFVKELKRIEIRKVALDD